MNRAIRVLLVDDDALVRAGLSMMLDGADGIDVVGEAGGRRRRCPPRSTRTPRTWC